MRDRLAQPFGQNRLGIRPGVGRLTGEHLVEHAAEGVDVGARIDVPLGRGLLRTHVLGSAQAESALGQLLIRFARERSSDPEVRNQGMVSAGKPSVTGRRAAKQDVLWLDVAMNHSALVGIVESVGHFHGDAQRVTHRELTLSQQPAPQRLALDVRHGEPELPVGVAGLVHDHDMRVLQTRAEPDLAEEPLGAQ